MVVTLLAFESMAVGTVMPVIADDLDGLSLHAWGFSAALIMSLLSTVPAGGWVDRSAAGRRASSSSAPQISDTLGSSLAVGVAGALVTGFGAARIGTGPAVAGSLFAATATLGVIAALRLEAPR